MSNVIERNKAFLQLLATTKSIEQRQGLLETATPGQVRALSEVVLNLIHNRPAGALDKKKRDILNKHSDIKVLNRLSTNTHPYGRKRQTLINAHAREIDTNQTGDGIFSVLAPIISQLFGL